MIGEKNNKNIQPTKQPSNSQFTITKKAQLNWAFFIFMLNKIRLLNQNYGNKSRN